MKQLSNAAQAQFFEEVKRNPHYITMLFEAATFNRTTFSLYLQYMLPISICGYDTFYFDNHMAAKVSNVSLNSVSTAKQTLIAAGILEKGDAANVFKFVNKESNQYGKTKNFYI